MTQLSAYSTLKRLKVERIVNAYGPATILGGSVLDSRVNKAMEDVSRVFVDMDQLLERAGTRISEILNAEAAYVTSGAAAGLTLSTAGCMTGTDPSKIQQLPDASGMRNEVLIQNGQRNTYDRCVRLAGAKLVSVGLPYVTYSWEFEAAITEKTAATVYFTSGTRLPRLLDFEKVVGIAKRRSIPVIVDGCNEVLPNLENVSQYLEEGADLVLLSGGKTLQGPNDTGVIVGKRELVEACAANGFPHMNGIGRTMKVSKEQILGLITALEIYAERNPHHDYEAWSRKLDFIREQLIDLANITLMMVPDKPDLGTIPRLHIVLDEENLGCTASQIVRALKAWEPPVVLDIGYWEKFLSGTLVVDPSCLTEGDEKIVAKALAEVLSSSKKVNELLGKPAKVTANAYP